MIDRALALAVLGVAAVSAAVMQQVKYVPAIPAIEEVANSYFRIGQQAAMIALAQRRAIEEDLNRKYPDGFVTNAADFEILANPLTIIDDPRIFQVVRELNDGSVLGLDTNSWAGINKPPHILTVLRK